MLFVALFYVGLVAFLLPFFEFPLNDDVAYAKAVEYFIQNQSIKLSDWIAVSLVFQLFYGAVFSAPFGFSFSALRVSTLLLSFIGTGALFLILRELRFSEGVSLLGALVLATNPVYLNLRFCKACKHFASFIMIFLPRPLERLRSYRKSGCCLDCQAGIRDMS